MSGEFACRDVGRYVPRQCTDRFCGFIFLLMNMLLVALLVVSIKQGDLKKITHGTDYNGNVCGEGYPNDLLITKEEWASRTLLWYPFSYDSATKEFRITSAVNYGICVSDCNPSSGEVSTYGGSANPTAQTFKVWLSSSSSFHRCLPNFKTFTNGNNNTKPDGDESNGKAAKALGFGGFFFGLVQQVYSSLWVTFLYFLAAVVLCFVWIILMRRIVKPVVIAAIVLVIVVGGGIVFALFSHFNNLQKDPSTHNSDDSRISLAIAIGASVLLFLFICAMLFLRKSIMLSCDIIEEGSRIIADIPQIMTMPLVTSVLMFGVVVMCASVAALLYTVGSQTMTTTTVENSFGQMVAVTTRAYERPVWVDVAQVYNLFMFLWLLAFCNGIAYMTISLTGVIWFFSRPGNEKDVTSPVSESFGIVCKKHVGTVAFGTLVFAIIGILRAIMNAIEKKMRKRGDNTPCCLIMCCVNCCLGCLDRIVRFLTEHGFVMTAMTGMPLIPAAREGVALLTATPAVLSINLISDVILVISRVLIVILITFAGVASLNARANDDSTHMNDTTVAACAILLAVGVWGIAGAFTRVLTVCIDTTLLCFAYDMKHHNGMDKPYYSPDDLKAHIDAASRRHNEKEESLMGNKTVDYASSS